MTHLPSGFRMISACLAITRAAKSRDSLLKHAQLPLDVAQTISPESGDTLRADANVYGQ